VGICCGSQIAVVDGRVHRIAKAIEIRLQEARRLLLAGEVDVARAGYQVGYDDPSHVSREYKKVFGEPPLRDVERLQGLTAGRAL
jgi:AraC-like DNA-binding protein